MGRKTTTTKAKLVQTGGARTLTMSDARSFDKFAKTHTATIVRSRASARKFLVASGMLTPSGHLTSRYKTPKA